MPRCLIVATLHLVHFSDIASPQSKKATNVCFASVHDLSIEASAYHNIVMNTIKVLETSLNLYLINPKIEVILLLFGGYL